MQSFIACSPLNTVLGGEIEIRFKSFNHEYRRHISFVTNPIKHFMMYCPESGDRTPMGGNQAPGRGPALAPSSPGRDGSRVVRLYTGAVNNRLWATTLPFRASGASLPNARAPVYYSTSDSTCVAYSSLIFPSYISHAVQKKK